MADYYTHFHFVVPCDHPDDLVDTYRKLTADVENLDEVADNHPIFADLDEIVLGLPTLTSRDGGVVVDDNCEGDLAATCAVVKWMLTHSGTPDEIYFEWCNWCTKPRTDAYGGGASLVTSAGWTSICTSDLHEQLTDDLAARTTK